MCTGDSLLAIVTSFSSRDAEADCFRRKSLLRNCTPPNTSKSTISIKINQYQKVAENCLSVVSIKWILLICNAGFPSRSSTFSLSAIKANLYPALGSNPRLLIVYNVSPIWIVNSFFCWNKVSFTLNSGFGEEEGIGNFLRFSLEYTINCCNSPFR